LSQYGTDYARLVTEFLSNLRVAAGKAMYPKVFTSTRRRSYQTAQFFPSSAVTQKTPLVQLNPGAVEALAEDEIKARYPEEFVRHQADPFSHRYPRSESYHDLALRLEHVILELEGERDDVLVIAHETVLQCLYAYLMDLGETVRPYPTTRNVISFELRLKIKLLTNGLTDSRTSRQ
jgi:6-phosphofructo-2-kinase/fructose-2,6-biphosphatase 4